MPVLPTLTMRLLLAAAIVVIDVSAVRFPSLLSVTVALLAACGGSEFSTEDGDPSTGGSAGASTGGTSGGGQGGTTVTGDPLCPATEPGLGEPCTTPNLSCSFGNSPRPSCRPRYQCTNNGWISLSGASCPADVTCPPLTPGPGDTCLALNQVCSYPNDAIFCGCPACPTFCATYRWSCSVAPPAPCPTTLPNQGSGCDVGVTDCFYGNCALDDAVAVDCDSGRWNWKPAACPTG